MSDVPHAASSMNARLMLQVVGSSDGPDPNPPVSTLLTRAGSNAMMYIQNLYRTKMKATVKKWGNSAAVRIPVSVMEAMHLRLDEIVEVREEKGRIIIEPALPKKYALDDLLKGITKTNLHEAVDFGPPEGKEV